MAKKKTVEETSQQETVEQEMADNAELAKKSKLKEENAKTAENHVETFSAQTVGMPINMSDAYNMTPASQQLYTTNQSHGNSFVSEYADDEVGFGGYIMAALSIILLFVIVFAILASTATPSITAQGKIMGDLISEQGDTVKLTYILPSDFELEEGDSVTWYLNGEEVTQTEYKRGAAISASYSDLSIGEHTVRAEINGKSYAENTIFVGIPTYSKLPVTD